MNKRILTFANIMLLFVVTVGNAATQIGNNEFPSENPGDLDRFHKSDDNLKVDKTRRIARINSKGNCILNSQKNPAGCTNPNGYNIELENSGGIIFNENDNDNQGYSSYDSIAQNNNNFVILKKDIILVQQALNKLGYNAGGVDGVAHNKTINAIIDLQKAEGLPITGEIDQQLLDFLEIR